MTNTKFFYLIFSFPFLLCKEKNIRQAKNLQEMHLISHCIFFIIIVVSSFLTQVAF
jgi:hypothetical protein